MKPQTQSLLNQAITQDRSYLHYRDPANFSFPALEFEQATGLKNVGKRYQMPGGQTEHAVHLPFWETYLKARAMDGACRIANSLEEFSPESVQGYKQAREAELQALLEQEPHVRGKDVSADEAEKYALKRYMVPEQLKAAQLLEDVMEQEGPNLSDVRNLTREVKQDYSTALRQLFNQFRELNPELGVLEIETEKQMHDVVEGVLSGFNVADIKRFSIDGITYEKAMRTDPNFGKRMDAIEEKAGARMYWVPAPSTLLHVENQLQRREQTHAAVR